MQEKPLKSGARLPRGPRGSESGCQRRGRELDPCSGKIPLASERRSRCATAPEPVLESRRVASGEGTAMRRPRAMPGLPLFTAAREGEAAKPQCVHRNVNK